MKRVITFLLVSSVIISAFCVSVCAESVSVSAQAYILYCTNNEKIILSDNEDLPLPMASTTKLMTTVIALEREDVKTKKVKFTEEMIAEGSSMYLEVGECVTLYDLCIGMMMQSGNDAANAAAITIGGSINGFADIMNEKAKEIGMKNTHFVTPSGLDDKDHYSSAYDMALLMTYALKNNSFREITKSKSMKVDFIYPPDKSVTYQNHNKLLSMYDCCIGGKTGYTMTAGRCLVSACEKDNLTFVCVTLNDHDDWDDQISLFDYGYENYTSLSVDIENLPSVPVFGGEKDSVIPKIDFENNIVLSKNDAVGIVKKVYIPSFLYAPINIGDEIGKIVFENNENIIAEIPIISSEEIKPLVKPKNIIDKIKEFLHWKEN
ncbi:MAG: D-alanyl-D-alanine carboxypeptidase [Oscillospiraceae bacterium]|nr:D-alanyl-D-alanine carboxypeptidase [Candidatus Ruminococcus equi]